MTKGATYCLIDGTEFLELLTQGSLLGVPGKATSFN